MRSNRKRQRRNVVIVNNAPAPYRVPVYDELSRLLDGDLHVVYCTGREPGRLWDLPPFDHEHTILEETSRSLRHNHPSIAPLLGQLDPGIVITGGFAPSFLYAFYWSVLRGRKHIPLTDGTPDSEAALGPIHRAARRAIYKRSDAFLGASDRSLDLYRCYGVREDRLFKTVLAVDTRRFADAGDDNGKEFDLVFSGRLTSQKMPDFFLDVCAKVMGRRSTLKGLVLGDGPLRRSLRERVRAERLDVTFAGHCNQNDLPRRYRSGRLLLFPTQNDTWGIVANEALAAGLPVITCPAAGAAGELVVHGQNGYILPIDAEQWAMQTIRILDDSDLWNRMSGSAKEMSSRYDFALAAQGILAAVKRVS